MNNLFIRIFILLLVGTLKPVFGGAQVASGTDTATNAVKIIDTSRALPKDSLTSQKIDSSKPIVRVRDSVALVKPRPDTTLQWFNNINPYVNVKAPLVYRSEPAFLPTEKDLVFYVLLGLLFVLGLVRLVFAKYFNDLFRIFFQTTFRQKSIREQLLQNKMASMVLNFFFCISGGLFLYFVAGYKGWLEQSGFIQKGLLCIVLVAIVYTTKYVGLRISGWLFGMTDVTETYLFIVFLINKVVGVMLLPSIIILALGDKSLQPILLVVSLLLLSILYLYRYLIALPLVRNHSGLTGFHFFIYLCAFEVVPVLLIYKLLLLMLSR
jgi:hypothetical protein